MTIIIPNMLLYIIRRIREKFLYNTISYNADFIQPRYTEVYCNSLLQMAVYINNTMIKIITNRNLYIIINLLDFQILLISITSHLRS